MCSRLQNAIGSSTMIVAITLCAAGGLLTLELSSGWEPSWRSIGITSLTPHFFDMHAVTEHAACAAQGYKAYELNKCDPGTKFNYPPIWLALGRLGINGSDSVWLSILFAVSAFVVVVTLFKGRSPIDGVLGSLAILSPS